MTIQRSLGCRTAIVLFCNSAQYEKCQCVWISFISLSPASFCTGSPSFRQHNFCFSGKFLKFLYHTMHPSTSSFEIESPMAQPSLCFANSLRLLKADRWRVLAPNLAWWTQQMLFFCFYLISLWSSNWELLGRKRLRQQNWHGNLEILMVERSLWLECLAGAPGK